MSWIDDLPGVRTLQDDGTDVPSRSKVNFIGAGVSVADNPTTKTTDVTISGGGGGGGDVAGPVSSTDNAIARWNGASGDVVQDSLVTVDDVGNISIPSGRTVDGRDPSVDGAALDNHVGSTSNPHSVTAAQVGAAPTSRAINTGTGLSGGGDLGADRTINLVAATTSTIGGMSAADKTKLDSIDANATANTISTNNPQALGTAAPGASGEVSDSAHVHPHGDQAGGTLHAVASGAAAGFMSAADKSKLDGIEAGADATTLSASVAQPLGTAAAGSTGEASDAGHVHPHGDQAGGTQHAVATTSVAGFLSAADKLKLDTVEQGANSLGLSGSTPQPVASTGTAGATGLASDAGHAHAHGDQAGGALHAVATSGANGFMSAADKAKMDGIAAGATATPISASAAQTVGTSNSAGSTGQAADAGHIHAHGAQTDGTLHAAATTSVAGFMAAADKTTLDALKGGFHGLHVEVVTSYTPVLADAGQLVGIAHSSDIVVTLPPNSSVAFPYSTATGGATVLSFLQLGGGEITLAPGSGVTIQVPPGRAAKTKGPGSMVQAIKAGTNAWYLVGDLVEAFDAGQQFETIAARFTSTVANAPSATALTIAPNTVFGANATISVDFEYVARIDGVNSAGLEAPTYQSGYYRGMLFNADGSGNMTVVGGPKGVTVGDGPFDAVAPVGDPAYAIPGASAGSMIISVAHPATLAGTAEWSFKLRAHALSTAAPADFS